jgi:hypothetical protein
MGDGVTRKSLKDVHMLEAKTGNFTANFPIAWTKKEDHCLMSKNC